MDYAKDDLIERIEQWGEENDIRYPHALAKHVADYVFNELLDMPLEQLKKGSD